MISYLTTEMGNESMDNEANFNDFYSRYVTKREYHAKSDEEVRQAVDFVNAMITLSGRNPVYKYFKNTWYQDIEDDDGNENDSFETKRYICECLFCDYVAAVNGPRLNVTNLTAHIGCRQGCPGLPQALRGNFINLFISYQQHRRKRYPESLKEETIDPGYDAPMPSTSNQRTTMEQEMDDDPDAPFAASTTGTARSGTEEPSDNSTNDVEKFLEEWLHAKKKRLLVTEERHREAEDRLRAREEIEKVDEELARARYERALKKQKT